MPTTKRAKKRNMTARIKPTLREIDILLSKIRIESMKLDRLMGELPDVRARAVERGVPGSTEETNVPLFALRDAALEAIEKLKDIRHITDVLLSNNPEAW